MNDIMMVDRAVAAMFTDFEGVMLYDEVSLLFKDVASLIDFQHACYLNGLQNFDSVKRDTMQRLDVLGESFDVRFEFFRLPKRPWRIEAMVVLSGDAPLHEQALAANGSGAPFHLSYKVADEVEYDGQFETLRANGHTMMAEYRNSYGMMSYWTHDGDRGPYIKPRVNTRDT